LVLCKAHLELYDIITAWCEKRGSIPAKYSLALLSKGESTQCAIADIPKDEKGSVLLTSSRAPSR